MRPLIGSQIKQILALHLEGESVDDIAAAIKTDAETVRGNLPSGEVGLSYRKVIDAKALREGLSSKLSDLKEAKTTLSTNDTLCSTAIAELDLLVSETQSALKRMKAHGNALAERQLDLASKLVQADELIVETETSYEQSVVDFGTAAACKDEAIKTQAEIRNKEAKRKDRIATAERMAEEAIMNAAVKAAQAMVAESIGKRLEREEAQ